MAAELLQQEGVPVVPGSTLAGPGYVRMSVLGDEAIVAEAVRRFGAYAHRQREVA